MAELPDWARSLDLTPHPEGGWYRETWRSGVTVPATALPDHPGARSAGTAILFLLLPGQQSAWHTVRSEELWLWHRGGPLQLDLGGDGDQPGPATERLLGADLLGGQTPQLVVPARHWQRARPTRDEPTLVSCVVVPGFDFADFRLEC
ncbi:cupin domain-containing protein [Rhodococcus spelaei]|uniref:Cupin domain-containing protein n=1 Tax=Rhodococcus spelaei TaxID=2546320 RepID=A0A541BRQ2_9NOCA|nr:cupin domain-containing protein [Rhodococcus spelaei]TQF74958.1 cupin domain-containing protein [Rhodococcus spelaei]